MEAKFYNSLDELTSKVANVRVWDRGYGRDEDFYGARSLADAVRKIKAGASEAEQAPAIALLDKIDAETHGRKRLQHTPAMAGERPDVGAYLVGNPQNMKRKVRVEHDRAPIRLVMESTVSAGVTHEQLIRRGAAIAALAMRLNELRPVELYCAWATKPGGMTNCLGMVRLGTSPLSMAEVVEVFASREFCRAFMFAVMREQVGTHSDDMIGWAFGYGKPTRNGDIRKALGLEPQDIFIPGGMLSEADQFLSDPVAWVNGYLDTQRDFTD